MRVHVFEAEAEDAVGLLEHVVSLFMLFFPTRSIWVLPGKAGERRQTAKVPLGRHGVATWRRQSERAHGAYLS